MKTALEILRFHKPDIIEDDSTAEQALLDAMEEYRIHTQEQGYEAGFEHGRQSIAYEILSKS